MTPAETSHLRSVMNTADQLRPIGDAPVAKSLQAQGFATVAYLEEMSRIRVEPTAKGKRYIAVLNNARASVEPTHRSAPPRAVE